MSWLRTIFYALLSGFTEFLPVSSRAHQMLYMKLFGMDGSMPVLNLFVHLGELVAVLFCCWPIILRLRRGQQHRRRPGTRRVHMIDFDNKLSKTAMLPMVILLALNFSSVSRGGLLYLTLTLAVGAAFILVSEHIRHGNKDSRHMSGLDGIALGVVSGLSFLPGISRIGAGISYGVARGADRKHAINWVILLSVPALIMLIVSDFVMIFSGVAETISFVVILQYLLAVAAAFFAGYGGIQLMRILAKSIDFSGFGYYSLGVALLSLFIYLIV